MFQTRTVFVLGAGSSHEVGLPLGKALAATISELFDFKFENGTTLVSGDPELYSSIRQKFRSEANEYRRAGAFIASGIQLADSIDDFLSLHHSDDRITFIGKLGVAKAIFAAEQNSYLYPRGPAGEEIIDFGKLKDTWFVKLFKMLSRELPKESVDTIFNNVSFVNFNYDRCLEFFLSRGLQKLYEIDRLRAAEIVSRVKVFRPYGSVGPLKMAPNATGIDFGANDVDFIDAAGRIKTYSEKIDEGAELESVRDEIAAAKLIVFLGMHFHEQNIKLIAPRKKTSAENIFATAVGFSDEDRSVIDGQINIFLAKKFRDGNFIDGETPIRIQNLTWQSAI